MGESKKPLHFTGGLRVKAEFFNSSSLDTLGLIILLWELPMCCKMFS